MQHYPFTNTPLPYDYNALEPYIDEKTMMLHHDRHLQTYTDNLNKALAPYPELHNLSLEQLLTNVPRMNKKIGEPILKNAGGVYNHRFYFDQMSPNAKKPSDEILLAAIVQSFGSLENFKDEFNKAAMSVFGSGYAWLVSNRNGNLAIITSANQDAPFMLGFCPILNIDVWEHAYYLKHYNKRADYIKNWWNVIDFPTLAERYLKCTHE